MKLMTRKFWRPLTIVAFLLSSGAAWAVPPTVVDDGPIVIDEGGSITNFDLFANDTNPEPGGMNPVLVDAPSFEDSFTLSNNGTFDYTHDGLESVQDTFTYRADNGELSLTLATVTITINPVNDAPTIDSQDPLSTPEEIGLTIQLTDLNVTDPDDNYPADFTLSVQNGANYTRIGNTITPVADFNGALTVPVTVNDGDDDSPSFNLTVSVTAANDQPVITGQNLVTTPEATGRTILLTDLTVTDPDNNYPADFTLSVQNGANYTRIGNTITPVADFNGDLTVPVTVQDDSGAPNATSAVFNMTVTVSAVNNVPQITGQVPLTTAEETGLAITLADLTVVDADNNYPDDFTLSVQGGPNYTVLGNTITPVADFNGNLSVPVTVFDGTSSSTPFPLVVSVTAVNDQPVITGQNPVTTPEATEITLQLTDLVVTDPDNTYPADFTLTVQPGTNYTVLGDAITPDVDFNGDLSVPVTVTDNSGELNATSAVFNMTVTVTEVNNVPAITGQVPLSTLEDTPLLITLDDLTVTDADSVYPDEFTLTVQLGANFTFVGNTITPILDFSGDLSVPVIVNDGTDDSAVFNLLVTVTPVNDPPQFAGLVAPLNTTEDTTLTIVIEDLVILDPDNIFPTDFTLILDPAVVPADNYTLAGATSITPAENFNGQLNVRATVQDNSGEPNATSPPFVIVVSVDPINDLPVLVAPIGPINAIEDTPFNLDISTNFMDADGDQLEYTATWIPAKPPNIDLDLNSGVFSGTPRFVDTEPPGPVYQVTVTATDQCLVPADCGFVSDTFELTISALGRANLSLSISVTPDTGTPGDDLRWTFTSRNPIGPVPGENVELSGSFVGSALTVSVEGGANCTIQPEVNQVTPFVCVLGSLPVGATTSTVLTTATSQASEVVAFGAVAGTEVIPIDPNLDDNSSIEAAGVADAFSAGAVQILGNSSVRSVTAGDVNGDGAADLVVGTAAGQSVQIYFNDAARESCQCLRDFLSAPISVPDTGSNEGVALADFDGNGSLDLVVANGGGQQDRVFSNDGAGNFVAMATLDPSFGQDVSVGDFDNDGDMDVAIAANGGNPVYLGNGNGGFNLHATLGNANSAAVETARFDGNSRDDLVFANVGGNSAVWTKNVGAGFTRRDQLNIGDAVAVAAADLNNDGRPDLVFGRVPSLVGGNPQNPETPANPVLINDGSGRFGNPSVLLGISPTNDVHIGDVNRDGLPDLVFVGASGVHQIWTAGGGGYSLHREQIIDSGAMAGVLIELGETDNGEPGGVDLAMGGASSGGLGVYLNDSFGNLGRGDAVPPVLTLLGQASVSVVARSSYPDAGATAADNIDGDISRSIAVSGSVDIRTVGTYTLTYNVVDFAGNAATPITRTVTVTPDDKRGGGGGTISYFTLLSLLIGVWCSHRNRATRSTRKKVV